MKISFAETKLPTSGYLVFLVGGSGDLAPSAKAVDKATKGRCPVHSRRAVFRGRKAKLWRFMRLRGVKLSIVLVGTGAAVDLDALKAQEIGAQIYKGAFRPFREFGDCRGRTGAQWTRTRSRSGRRSGGGARMRSYRYDKYLTKTGSKPRQRDRGSSN